MRSLTVWVTPFTNLGSLDEAIGAAKEAASSISTSRTHWAPSLLVPAHYGIWPQAECRQSLPDDMRFASPDDVAACRATVEAAGLGFGVWGVPNTGDSGTLAGQFAAAAGYYSANFEPPPFWLPGDDPAAVDAWWTDLWAAAGDELGGSVTATVIPNQWGLDAFKNSLPNLAAGCNGLALEVYGGLQTAGSYPYPNLWPQDGVNQIRATGVNANLIPILARANLTGQIGLAARLGAGNVHVWAI